MVAQHFKRINFMGSEFLWVVQVFPQISIHLEPVNETFFENSLWGIDQVKMRSSWIKMGPHPLSSILTRGKFRQRYSGNGRPGQEMMETEIGVTHLQAKEGQRLLTTPETKRKAQNRFFPGT